ncbi:hypothetical protein V6615_01035 [Oscillospiraceae bacterium PP1C4]
MSSNTIFRKASLDRVSSPEQLNDYIKISRPGVWLNLGTVIVLLIGVCVWGVFGTLTSTKDAVTLVQGGKAICYVTAGEAKSLAIGMQVRIGDNTGSITSFASTPIKITDDFDAYALYLSGLKTGDWVVPVTIGISVPDGTYTAKIVLETISPISFVLN